MELNEFIVTVLIGIGIGCGMVILYAWYLYQRLMNQIDQLVDQAVQQAEADLVGLDIEVDCGTYFCYNSEDKQFVCQGATASEIRAGFRARFPDKTAYIAGGDPAVVAQFREELTQLSLHEPNNNV